MKKEWIYVSIFVVGIVLGILIGIKLASRYEIVTSGQGLIVYKIDKLTGNVEYTNLARGRMPWKKLDD